MTSYYIIVYHVISYRIISYCIISYYIMLYYGCITMPQLNTPVFDIFTYDFKLGYMWLQAFAAFWCYRFLPWLQAFASFGSSHFGLKFKGERWLSPPSPVL